MRLSKALLIVAVACMAPAGAMSAPPVVPTQQPLPTIAEVRAHNGVATLTLDAVMDPHAPRPLFSYNGVPGLAPTIRVHPGDTIHVTLHNRLPRSKDTDNDVNLHFHGLDVAPTPGSDDVLMTIARPGQTLVYNVHVPRTQPPGLYWYHPHSHGETYWQVTSGMAGAIVIEGIQARIPQAGSMRERILVVRDRQIFPNLLGIPWYARPRTPKNFVSLPDDDNQHNGPCRGEANMATDINGVRDPIVGINPGEEQFFRIVNATASRVLDLAIDGAKLQLVARDGYPLASYPGAPAMETLDHIVIPPAGRAEFIVRGGTKPALMRSRCYQSGPAGDPDPAIVLAQLKPDGVAFNKTSELRAPMKQSRSKPELLKPNTYRTIQLQEDDDGFRIDNKRFDMMAPPLLTIHAGTLEEWTIENHTDEVHDFHLHQVHFAVESIDGKAVTPVVWSDTVLVPTQHVDGGKTVPGTARVLVDFRNPIIKGTFLMHCHMLDHEDGGMMAKIQVI